MVTDLQYASYISPNLPPICLPRQEYWWAWSKVVTGWVQQHSWGGVERLHRGFLEVQHRHQRSQQAGDGETVWLTDSAEITLTLSKHNLSSINSMYCCISCWFCIITQEINKMISLSKMCQWIYHWLNQRVTNQLINLPTHESNHPAYPNMYWEDRKIWVCIIFL